MSDDSQQPIVVKKIKKGGGAAHGGAWKIAYADFVTAMMAFFLLMWLLGSTSKGDLKGIADHFQTPLLVAMFGGSGAGDASSIIQGGGQDLSQSYGQVKRGETKSDRKISEKRMKEEFERKERERLQNLKEEIEKLIEATPALKQFKSQLLLDITSEGLRIQIIDEKNRPMFDLASSELKPYTKQILREFGPLLNQVENRITLSGHTDATPFAGGDRGFGNWELSTNRANASRRELVTGGLDDAKIIRVVGFASTVLYDKEQPQSASNRRISIVVMNKRTEEAILSDGKENPVAEVGDAEELAERVIAPPLPTGPAVIR
ncbi:MAG: flagellar motor protein MotB [Gammaproteobacteria bacterium]|nr:flagellar motor protein MotB [Rhodocyclaceae bacterium]MBU3910488.1 flagellar motor protein MotB [Gammaproteobacteria bacterium]MBU3989610.1 flagellar motor protein MotB [Gammaproteobacteria bacterium]MBU4004969.1 flagellar motor protein MotB [Gammaproteobacteria bacterium]MBU4020562.1 flagellar motor protein MotB [Gammaproteobacteria bacterium]